MSFTTLKRIIAWSLFDFANTSYSVIIVTLVYALYFRDVVAGATGAGDLYWGIAVSASMLISALLAPPLGAAADSSKRKKSFLLVFTLVSVAATACLWFVQDGMIAAGMILFILANIGFEGGIVFYDAFLPLITTPRSYGRVSGYGFAMGYVGAFAVLAACYPLVSGGFEAANLPNIRFTFILSSAFFLVFSLPLFFLVPERHAGGMRWSFVRDGFVKAGKTIRRLRDHPDVAWFLAAFFLYNDGILTVITFASIYAKVTLAFSMAELMAFFLLVQTTSIAGSVLFGVLTDHFGAKRMIKVSLVGWLFVVAGGYFATTKMIQAAVLWRILLHPIGKRSISDSMTASAARPLR
jgi:UMF1 family MFS transporter